MSLSLTSAILLAFAIVIITVLATYAYRLLAQVKQQQKLKQQAELTQQHALNQHDKKIFDSVIIIVRAMKEEQCDFSEGCWRLSVLLESLKLSTGLPEKYPAIFALYNEIKHMSILANRKKLAKKDRMKEDFTRMKIEAKWHDKIVLDLDSLHQYSTEHINNLAN